MNMRNGTEALLVIFVLSLVVVVVPYQIQRSHALYSAGNIVRIADSNTNTTTTSEKIMEGFSLYNNSIHNISMQYPSDWDREEVFNNDAGALVQFTIPSGVQFAKSDTLEDVLRRASNAIHNPSDILSLSIKSLPVYPNHILQNITNDEIQSLKTRFSNLNLLSTSYDAKMGQLPASKLVYNYTEDNMDKKAMQINSLKGQYKAIFITYTAAPQDFDKFLPTVNRIISSFSINN
jgi:eukaryotic-like serine/threonine-protein kinase